MTVSPLAGRQSIGEVALIGENRRLFDAPLRTAPNFAKPGDGGVPNLSSRTLFAAAHVVPDPLSETVPGGSSELDWEATLNYRRQIFSWGVGVADAMDTAQRNMGLDPVATRQLIARSAHVARQEGGTLAVGINTDARSETVLTLEEIEAAYLEQLSFAEEQGVIPVLMASRHLARAAQTPADYRRVYSRVLAEASTPVIIHWLGEAFDPQLRGYFGSVDWRKAADTLVDILHAHVDVIRGVKMSLLDAEAEREVRARLPEGSSMFTGDDFNYVDLIGGDSTGQYSDALLGAFSVLAPNASAAVQALDIGNEALYREILLPTQELSRQIFAAPTFYYKTGVAFLSWLNGHQQAFSMISGLHSARSLPHLSRIVELANDCGALERPELARERWHRMLTLHGLDVYRPGVAG